MVLFDLEQKNKREISLLSKNNLYIYKCALTKSASYAPKHMWIFKNKLGFSQFCRSSTLKLVWYHPTPLDGSIVLHSNTALSIMSSATFLLYRIEGRSRNSWGLVGLFCPWRNKAHSVIKKKICLVTTT